MKAVHALRLTNNSTNKTELAEIVEMIKSAARRQQYWITLNYEISHAVFKKLRKLGYYVDIFVEETYIAWN